MTAANMMAFETVYCISILQQKQKKRKKEELKVKQKAQTLRSYFNPGGT